MIAQTLRALVRCAVLGLILAFTLLPALAPAVGAQDAAIDSDGDGLSDEDELYVYGTDPVAFDTDEDGASDGDEINVLGTDPLSPDAFGGDQGPVPVEPAGDDPCDSCRLVDTLPSSVIDDLCDNCRATRTTPYAASFKDTDGDGLTDADEAYYGTNPTKRDSDSDFLRDGDELFVYGTNPLAFDTDGDGVGDHQEIRQGTNPLAPDSDGDGVSDHCDYEPLIPDGVRLPGCV
jgi:hypothetical protein